MLYGGKKFERVGTEDGYCFGQRCSISKKLDYFVCKQKRLLSFADIFKISRNFLFLFFAENYL